MSKITLFLQIMHWTTDIAWYMWTRPALAFPALTKLATSYWIQTLEGLLDLPLHRPVLWILLCHVWTRLQISLNVLSMARLAMSGCATSGSSGLSAHCYPSPAVHSWWLDTLLLLWVCCFSKTLKVLYKVLSPLFSTMHDFTNGLVLFWVVVLPLCVFSLFTLLMLGMGFYQPFGIVCPSVCLEHRENGFFHFCFPCIYVSFSAVKELSRTCWSAFPCKTHSSMNALKLWCSKLAFSVLGYFSHACS